MLLHNIDMQPVKKKTMNSFIDVTLNKKDHIVLQSYVDQKLVYNNGDLH